jgi:hypothetical protein
MQQTVQFPFTVLNYSLKETPKEKEKTNLETTLANPYNQQTILELP